MMSSYVHFKFMDASFFKYHSYHQHVIIVTPGAHSVTTF